MPQIVLDQTRIPTTVGQRVATAMPEHMRVDVKRKRGSLRDGTQQIVDPIASKLLATFGYVNNGSGYNRLEVSLYPGTPTQQFLVRWSTDSPI
jgi:hypothetical protein